MKKNFIIKGRQINCEIVRSRRKTVAIQIYPDKRIELKVPLLCNIENVEPFLEKHYRWIFKRLDAPIISKHDTKRFVSGELHYFLGKQYPLLITISPDNNVAFLDNTLMVYAKYDIPELIETLLEKWYLSQARRIFHEISIPLMKQMLLNP